MPYKGIESLDEDCIKKWLVELNPRIALNYGDYFLRYREWFRAEGYWSSVEAMLDDRSFYTFPSLDEKFQEFIKLIEQELVNDM